MIRFRILSGPNEGQVLEVDEEHVSIGRGDHNVLAIDADDIAEDHCAVTLTGGRWVVQDMGSENGTFVRDEQVADSVPIDSGDVLRVGALEMAVEYDDGAADAAPAAPVGVSADVIATARYEDGGIDLSAAGSRVEEAGAQPVTAAARREDDGKTGRLVVALALLSIVAAAVSLAIFFLRAAAA